MRLLLLATLLCTPSPTVADDPFSLDSSLCTAVETGDLDQVEEVFANEVVDVNAGCTFLNTNYPLGTAAKMCFLDIGQFLIEQHANVNQPEPLGYTPVLYSAENLDANFATLLLSNGADINVKAMGMGDLDSSMGMDIMSVAAASYLRQYPFASVDEQVDLTNSFYELIDVLHRFCFDFVVEAQVAQNTLSSQNHQEEADYISNKANEAQNECPVEM